MNPFEQEATIEKKLFANAMKSNWKDVIDIYKSNPESHKAKITRSGDTAIHIAISDGQESYVEELVAIVENHENATTTDCDVSLEALRMENDVGNTPLHLAACLGNVKMCYCIAKRDPTLIGIRNENKETPLYLAVLHGKKEVFLCLNYLCKNNILTRHRYGYCRAKDGNTILHSAIDGEYFEIAYHIIRDYRMLVNWVNEQGFSPLHTLASKPSAFKSGDHIKGKNQLIYHCIINLDARDAEDPLAEGLDYDYKNPKYPENYQTCVGIFLFPRNLVRVLMGRSIQKHEEHEAPVWCPSGQKHDEESPKVQQQPGVHEQESEKMNNKEEGQQPRANISYEESTKLPDNCRVCSKWFKLLMFLISKSAMIILGLVSSQVEIMREKKKKHAWSVLVMRKLIEHATLYEYENDGMRPPPSARQTTGFEYFSLTHEFDNKDANGNEIHAFIF